MTIAEAIAKVNELKPNTYSISDKVKWLSNLDGRINEEIISFYEKNEDDYRYTYTEVPSDAEMPEDWEQTYNTEYYVLNGTSYILNEEETWATALLLPIYTRAVVEFSGYTDDTAEGTELIVAYPYDEIYIYWLMAMIDFHNNEIAKYNNDMEMFNALFTAFSDWYKRHHKQKTEKIIYW